MTTIVVGQRVTKEKVPATRIVTDISKIFMVSSMKDNHYGYSVNTRKIHKGETITLRKKRRNQTDQKEKQVKTKSKIIKER